MSGVVLVPPKFQFLDALGNPLAGGSVDVFLAGTTTRTSTWQDQAQTSLNTNPIVLDSNGSCTMVVDDAIVYKLVVKSATGVTQPHLGGDNISGVGSNTPIAAVADYTALRAYTGNAKCIQVTGYSAVAAPSGIAGQFIRDDIDVSSTDNGGTTIVASNGKRWKRAFSGPVNVLWFGADLTGTADSAPAIQAAVDYAAYLAPQVTRGEVFVPDGMYRIDNTIHLGYGTDFTRVHLMGSGKRYNADARFGGTLLNATFGDRPAVVVQGGRGSKISKMAIVGVNMNYVANTSGGFGTPHCTVDDTAVATWVGPSVGANGTTRYAVYAGVAIDPYSGARPATSYPNVSYPAFLGAVSQYNKNFSSLTVLEDVQISGFVAGLAIQPCDADGNGDYTTLRDTHITYNPYGIVIGNGQSRCVNMQGAGFITNFHTAVDTRTFGRQSGKLAGHFSGVELGLGLNMLNIDAGFGGCTFSGCYSENLWSLGTVVGSSSDTGVTFIGCELHIYQVYITNYADQPRGNTRRHLSGTGVCRFIGGLIDTDYGFISQQAAAHIFDGVSTKLRMPFDLLMLPDGSAMSNTQIARLCNHTAGVLRRPFDPDGDQVMNVGMTLFSVTGSRTSMRMVGDYLNVQLLGRDWPLPAHVRSVYNGADFDKPKMATGVPILRTEFSKATTNCPISGITITFTDPFTASTSAFPLGIGDILHDNSTATFFLVTNKVGTTVTAMALNNLKYSGGVYSLTNPLAVYAPNAGTMEVRYTGLYSNTGHAFGDITSGSNVITNVGDETASVSGFQPQANDYLLWTNQGRSPWTQRILKLSAVDTGLRTMTLTPNANRSVAGEPLMLYYRP